jgi:hypothetical protein
MGRCTSVVNFKNEKASDKEWKIKKLDIPGPGSYKELEKSYNATLSQSPKIKFKSDKRVGFAEAISKSKNFVPSPHAYTFKDFKEEKVWKRNTNKRQ